MMTSTPVSDLRSHTSAPSHRPSILGASIAGRLLGLWRRPWLALGGAAVLALGGAAPADAVLPTEYWRGDTNNLWTGANWYLDAAGTLPAGIPNSTTSVFFSTSNVQAGSQATTLGADFTIYRLTIQDPADVTIGGSNRLTITGSPGSGIDVQAGAGAFTIDAALTLGPGADTITVNNAPGAAITGIIDGSNGLIKAGTGVLTLTGANIYTGGTTITDGTLKLGNGAAIGASVGAGDVTVGVAGTFVLNLADGATFSNHINNDGLVILDGATANNFRVTGDISGAGSLFKDGDNTVRLEGINTYAGDTTVEGGKLVVTGSMTNSTNTYVGYNNSDTTFKISNGGTVVDISASIGVIAGSSNNKARVTGAGSTWTNTGDLNVGFDGDHNTLRIDDGGQVFADFTKIGGSKTAKNNKVVITGAGSQLTNASDLLVGYGGKNNSLSILDGGKATNVNAFIGYLAKANNNEVLVSGAGSLWTNTGTFHLGYDGSVNTVTVADGGKVTVTGANQDALIGFNSGSRDNWLVVTGAGSEFVNDATLYVGNKGDDNSLQILEGGLVTSKNARIGGSATADGNFALVDGAGSIWNVGGTLRVGSDGTSNVMVISNGGVVNVTGNSFVGYNSGASSSFILVDGVGSSLNAHALTISRSGFNNLVQVIDGGNLTASSITLAELAGSSAFLQIGLGGAPGTVNAPTITGGAGFAGVLFSHDATGYVFNPTLAGNLFVVYDGPGETILPGANSYTGETAIFGGTLRTRNVSSLGTGNVLLFGGALALDNNLTVSSMDWSTAQVHLALATGHTLTVNGNLHNELLGGAFGFDLVGTTKSTYTLATFGTTDFAVGDFSALALSTANVQLQGFFTLNANDVQFTITGATASGPVLQNSAPVGVPTYADFTVDGPVTTGGPGEGNTVQTLTFLPGGSLTVLQTLTVTQGQVDLVAGSALELEGSLVTNALHVLPGGFLHGNGNIFGNLVNDGLVSPGNSPGEIHVTGNYAQSNQGTLRIEIGGRRPGQYDVLSVDGAAQLDGTLQLAPLNKFRPKRGDKFTFLTAGQGVSGEFATVENGLTSQTILEPTVSYEDTSVVLEMVQGSFADFASRTGLTPNQRSVARALDSAAYDKRADKLIDYLDHRNLEKLPKDFDRIAPEELTSIFAISTALAQVQSLNLQRRTGDLRSGSSGFSAGGLAMQGTGPGYSGGLFGAAGPTGDSKESKEVKTVVDEEKRWGAFLTGVGEWVDVSGDGNARGYDVTTGGFTLGLDYKVCPNFAVGIAAGYAGTSSDLADNGRVWVNGGKLGVYATTFVGGWYADAAVTGGYNSYDTKRSGLQGAARGSTDGGELNVLVGTGYDWKIGALSIGPTAAFNYTLTGIDGYTEHGSLAPLNVGGRNAESVTSAFGFKASYDWKCGSVLIRPEIRAAWQHEYGDSSYGLDGSFANGAGDSFLVNGPEIGRDSLLIGAGFAVQLSETCSTYLYYDGELARTRYDRHSVSGGFRVAF